MANQNGSTSIPTKIINLLTLIASLLKRGLINNTLQTISFIILFTIFPTIYYLYIFDVLNFTKDYPIFTIILSIVLFCSCLTIILLKTEPIAKKYDVSVRSFYKTFYNIIFISVLFLCFSLLFHISKFVIYNSTTASIIISFIIIILFLSLRIARGESKEDAEKFDDELADVGDELFDVIKSVIFTIPCMVIDSIKWVKKNISGLPATSRILTIIISLIIVLFYGVPFLKDFVKNAGGITFVQESKSLENRVLYLTQKELKEKIIESKSFARRKLLQKTDDFKTYLESNSDSISDLNKPITIEGFNKDIHLLDKHIIYGEVMDKMNHSERTLLNEHMKQNGISIEEYFNTFNKKIGKYNDISYSNPLPFVCTDKDISYNCSAADKIKHYTTTLRQENKYFELLDKIAQYNNNKNNFVHQEVSNLVHFINRSNHIQDYNYHYGLSFWVYFDPQIQNIQTTNEKRGFIMTYSNTPKLFYDYNTKELVITVDNCENKNKMCSENIIYKSRDILYQRWNHFVINYNYGTLDCFINNNLVSTNTKIAPYIDDAFLEFGRSEEPLYNCGICNITYYDIPLNITTIGDIYQSRKIPCDV